MAYSGGDWRERGACRDEDPELFFPIGHGESAQRQIERAKSICRSCPVIWACEGWAAEARPEYGVLAGLTADERKYRHGKPITSLHYVADSAGTCIHGHRRTPQNTRVTSSGVRRCRDCALASAARSRQGPVAA